MLVGDIEEAAGLEEVRDDSGPSPHVGQPGDRAIGGEYDVELAVDRRWRVVDIGADEARGNLELVAERARELDCFVGEIETCDVGTEARPRHGVESEVTLQMEHRLAAHVPYFGKLQVMQRVSSSFEAGKVVALGAGVHRND